MGTTAGKDIWTAQSVGSLEAFVEGTRVNAEAVGVGRRVEVTSCRLEHVAVSSPAKPRLSSRGELLAPAPTLFQGKLVNRGRKDEVYPALSLTHARDNTTAPAAMLC
jgi:hypothetical protein